MDNARCLYGVYPTRGHDLMALGFLNATGWNMTSDIFGREEIASSLQDLENGGVPYRRLKPPAIRFFPSGDPIIDQLRQTGKET